MHRTDLIEQFARERREQLLNEASDNRRIRQAAEEQRAEQFAVQHSFASRIVAFLRLRPASL